MAEKVEKAKKENRLQKWWRETIGELRKVNWPTRKEALRLTWIVIIVIVVMGSVLGLLDFGFTKLISLIIGTV
ncbi:MAG: preprotein translocase subunit SecE [Anaerolineaceae bacterium]|jgi:preprotein translocase subunit SecE|nr:preprotein translocase subunit SecE [Anaerolineaceae bacterium]